MLGLNVRPSGARADTVTASQLPSGDEPQAGQPGQGQVVVQIVEWGHCAFSPRLGEPPGYDGRRG